MPLFQSSLVSPDCLALANRVECNFDFAPIFDFVGFFITVILIYLYVYGSANVLCKQNDNMYLV